MCTDCIPGWRNGSLNTQIIRVTDLFTVEGIEYIENVASLLLPQESPPAT